MEQHPPIISRATISYDVTEDRVHVASELSTGDTILLSLTRRILNNLIPHLIAAENKICSQFHTEQGVSPRFLASEKTEGAVQDPVALASSTEMVLVASIDVTVASEHVVLDWKDSLLKIRARFLLPEDSLSLWLGALKTCFCKAAWPLDAWPSDVNEDSKGYTTVH